LSAAGLAGFHGLQLGEEFTDVAGVLGFRFSLGLIGGGEGIALGLKDAGEDIHGLGELFNGSEADLKASAGQSD
jgi:hypothetical protein